MARGDKPETEMRAQTMGRSRLSSVATAISLLKAFRVDDRELGISELSKRLGVSKSTVHRLATTLMSEGLLEQNPETERYRLGVALFSLGAMVRRRMDISAEAKLHLINLRADVEENVRLAVLDGAQVLYVYDYVSPQPVRLRSFTGLSKPAFCTAEGWTLLSEARPAEIDAILQGPFEPRSNRTPADAETVRARIAETAARGWATEDEESEDGMRALAAPVRDADGRIVAAVAIAGPRLRMRKRNYPQMSSKLLQAAKEISARLGWSGRRTG